MICLDDGRMRRDRLERALGDLDAVVERDDPVGDSLDDVHVVLDHENRERQLVAQPSDQLGDLVRLLGVHPGRRLIEHQQPRPRRERARDLEPAAIGVGERVGGLVPAVAGEPLAEEREHLGCDGIDLALLAARARQAEDRLGRRGLGVAVGRRLDVLLDAHVLKQPQALERPRDPHPRDPVRPLADD